jgi:hypothetical protein
MPSATRLAAATAVLGALGGLGAAPAGSAVRAQQWWLGSLRVAQAWQASRGAGVTVAVLGTGVAAGHPDLAGSVITGPDYSRSGRTPGGPYWGVEGTAVAGVIAGHGHGPGGQDGVVGVAPAAKILSVRVTLEYNDPLLADPALARGLPGAIAEGIRYAVDHGARVIDLPLDPGTLGLTGRGDPAAAGGSAAERAAVGYALGRNVVLVAPAGDDRFGPALTDYPAAYPGVIAVGAVGRDGRLASFSSRRAYAALTAPGVDMVAAAPPGGYAPISTTCMSSGIVAGVAALIVSRYPGLTVAQVTRALIGSTAAAPAGTAAPPLPARSAGGAGYGTVDAARAVRLAAVIAAAARPRRPEARHPRQHRTARPAAAPPPAAGNGALAGSVLRGALAAAGALIALLAAGLALMRAARRRAAPAAARRDPHARGSHERGGPGAPPHRAGSGQRPAAPGPPAMAGWSVPDGGLGSSLAGQPGPPPRPAITPAPRSVTGRAGRAPGAARGPAGPPWEPAPEPGWAAGPPRAVPRDLAPRPTPDFTAPPPPGLAAAPAPGFPARPADVAAAPVTRGRPWPGGHDPAPSGPAAGL